MSAIQCRELVGRQAEFGALTASLDKADQSGEMLFLVGEPGVGKSRLAKELAGLASSRGFTVAAGRAVQAASPVPLRPIIEAAMGLARTTGIPDTPELAEYRPALASIIPDCRHADRQAAEITPLILGEAFLRLLTSLDTKGTVLVLEDLHFADPETLAIVEYLTDNVANERQRTIAREGCADLLVPGRVSYVSYRCDQVIGNWSPEDDFTRLDPLGFRHQPGGIEDDFRLLLLDRKSVV